MFFHVQKLINDIPSDEPDPAAANALQEGLGGQFGEMRTMMQYLFQSWNARGDARPFKDLIQGVGIEEISHVELITTTINRLLDGSSRDRGNGDAASTTRRTGSGSKEAPGSGGSTPLKAALSAPNIHHLLVGAQTALPVDAAGNPWQGSYVYASGNLILDLLYNLMLESTGRLQKCRLYEMSDNKTFRATVSFLIARDHGHELVFAKALEKLGVDWGRTLPIPNFDARQWPEVKRLMDEGVHLEQHHFRLDGSLMAQVFNGESPSNDGTTVQTTDQAPAGFPIRDLPERPEEFAPGLTPELKELAMAAAELELQGQTRTASASRGGDAPTPCEETFAPRSKRVRMKK